MQGIRIFCSRLRSFRVQVMAVSLLLAVILIGSVPFAAYGARQALFVTPDQETDSEVVEAAGRSLCVRLAGEPDDPVPAETMDTDTASLLKLISEGLVVLGEDGEPVPGCAENWEVSDDGLKWTFYLREGLCWSDGEPMGAEDFEKMFRKIAEPSTEALYGHDLMQNIAGYEDVLNGDSDALQVSAKGDRKLVVKLSKPDPAFPVLCASWSLLPLREQIHGKSWKRSWENVTGNGPYRIAYIMSDEEYLLQKNPYYNNSGTPFEEVHWMVNGNVNQQYSDLLNGEMDAVSSIPEEEEPDAEDAGKQTESNILAGRQTTTDMIGLLFNCRQEALQDPRVRRALSVAVDREYISAEILDNIYAPSSDLTIPEPFMHLSDDKKADPETTAASDSGTGSEQSAAKSKEMSGSLREAGALLAEAGYKNGKHFPVLTCLVDENEGACLVAEYLVSVWKSLGIEVRIEKSGAKDLAQEKEKGMFDVVCGNLLLSSDLLTAELGNFVSDSEENVTGFSSKKYDKLMEKSSEIKEEKEYAEILCGAARILNEEVPAVPLGAKRISWVRQADLEGICCDASGCWQLWDVQKNKNPETAPEKNDPETVTAAKEPETTLTNKEPETARIETAAAAGFVSSLANGLDWKSPHTVTSLAGRFLLTGVAPIVSGPVENTVISSDSIPSLTGAGSEETAVTAAEKKGRALTSETFTAGISDPDHYYVKADIDAYLTSQAYVLDDADTDAGRLISLPKYTPVHVTGTGSAGYVRISRDGTFRYLEADKVTTDPSVLDSLRADEQQKAERRELLSRPMHQVKKKELGNRAADILAERDRILAEIAFQKQLRTQTRNPNWNGPVLSRGNGSVYGPSGKETYYNLNMNGVIGIMRGMGNTDEYWVRDDGCKMLGNYIMCAANLRVHPRGSLVESSLGTCIVCDTGGFASSNSHQLDIAVTW